MKKELVIIVWPVDRSNYHLITIFSLMLAWKKKDEFFKHLLRLPSLEDLVILYMLAQLVFAAIFKIEISHLTSLELRASIYSVVQLVMNNKNLIDCNIFFLAKECRHAHFDFSDMTI